MNEQERLAGARAAWRYLGSERPSFAVAPGPEQESVWDYPRPPRLEQDARHVEVHLGDVRLAATDRALRVLETASPPTFYIPRSDIDMSLLIAASGSSACEWKGTARYWGVSAGREPVAWTYPTPHETYASLRDHLAFYPARVECYVDGVRVQPQLGRFYGGWITPELVGPFKGEPGSEGW
jgi:uncharacterized protein (DUF427 family)